MLRQRTQDGEHGDQLAGVDEDSPGEAGDVLDVISQWGGYR